ncbi:hypothetical protein H6F93_21985 [Leptolyngbya sp. FACHB-671]|nr:hypothetical protein [Leptolyngbya sp. FACHB-671]
MTRQVGVAKGVLKFTISRQTGTTVWGLAAQGCCHQPWVALDLWVV